MNIRPACSYRGSDGARPRDGFPMVDEHLFVDKAREPDAQGKVFDSRHDVERPPRVPVGGARFLGCGGRRAGGAYTAGRRPGRDGRSRAHRRRGARVLGCGFLGCGYANKAVGYVLRGVGGAAAVTSVVLLGVDDAPEPAIGLGAAPARGGAMFGAMGGV